MGVPLTSEQKHNERKEAARKWLKKNCAKFACPACGEPDADFKDLIAVPTTEPGTVIVTCGKCSYLSTFSAASMKLPHPKEY